MCTISPYLEEVSGTEKSHASPASKNFRQIRMYEKEQALTVSTQETHRLSVHKNGHKPRTRRLEYFRFTRLHLFASRLSSQQSAMNTDMRSGLRTSSPALRPRSSPRRGRGASASPPTTDYFTPTTDSLNPRSMGGQGLHFSIPNHPNQSVAS